MVFPLLAIQKYAQVTGPVLRLHHQANGSRLRSELTTELRGCGIAQRAQDFEVEVPCVSPRSSFQWNASSNVRPRVIPTWMFIATNSVISIRPSFPKKSCRNPQYISDPFPTDQPLRDSLIPCPMLSSPNNTLPEWVASAIFCCRCASKPLYPRG